MIRDDNWITGPRTQIQVRDPPFTIRVAPQRAALGDGCFLPNVGAKFVFHPNCLTKDVIEGGLDEELRARVLGEESLSKEFH